MGFAGERVIFSRGISGIVSGRIEPIGEMRAPEYLEMLADAPVRALPVWYLENLNTSCGLWLDADKSLRRALGRDLAHNVRFVQRNKQFYRIVFREFADNYPISESVLDTDTASILVDRAIDKSGKVYYLSLDAARLNNALNRP